MPQQASGQQPRAVGLRNIDNGTRSECVLACRLYNRPAVDVERRRTEGRMSRIPYVDPAAMTDPEIRGYLELARREGTPRPESQAVRAHNPAVIRAFSQAWDLTFRHGVLDHAVKELCRVYVSKSIECDY